MHSICKHEKLVYLQRNNRSFINTVNISISIPFYHPTFLWTNLLFPIGTQTLTHIKNR